MNTMKPHQRGFSLIEMLVALLVLSIGLLGVAALQTKGQQFNHRAYLRTQATFLSQDLMERMRNNRTIALDGTSYALAAAPTAADKNCATAVCTPTELAEFDLEQWYALVQSSLPEGEASVVWNAANNRYDITISWVAERDENANLLSQTWSIVP